MIKKKAKQKSSAVYCGSRTVEPRSVLQSCVVLSMKLPTLEVVGFGNFGNNLSRSYGKRVILPGFFKAGPDFLPAPASRLAGSWEPAKSSRLCEKPGLCHSVTSQHFHMNSIALHSLIDDYALS